MQTKLFAINADREAGKKNEVRM